MSLGKHVIWVERAKVEVREFEVRPPQHDEVLVRTEVTLISPGTERAALLALPGTPGQFPTTAGYSNVGIVEAVGDRVEGLSVGMRVASSGGHGSHVVVDASRVLPVPESLRPEEAVFFHMITIAMQGVRRGDIEIGESVAVLGLGLVGQLALRLARLCGALPLVGIEPLPYRRKLALREADEVLDPTSSDFQERLTKVCGGLPWVVIEATGVPEPINFAFGICRRMGRVVLLGSTRGKVESVDFYRDVHRKGLTVIGAHTSARPGHDSFHALWTWRDDAALALRLLAMKRINVEELHTHTFEGEEAPKAYELLISGAESAIGIVLDWRKE